MKRDEVLRYDIWGNREGDTEMEVRDDGEWVRYEDYTTLREQLAVTVTEAMVRAAFVRLYPGCEPDEMQHYHAADIRAALTAALTHPTTPTRGSDE